MLRDLIKSLLKPSRRVQTETLKPPPERIAEDLCPFGSWPQSECHGCFLDRQWVGSEIADHTPKPPEASEEEATTLAPLEYSYHSLAAA
jgi:hypothetical protein